MTDSILHTLQQWHIHPVADHFTIALLFVAVLADLVGSLFKSRMWIRYMALTLMILGAGATAISWLTGTWAAHQVYDSLGPSAKALLHTHAELGESLVWIFAILTVWRIGVQAFEFAARSRSLYLIAAIIAICLLGYQGYLGGQLVYEHGVGTSAMVAVSSPQPSPAPPAVSSPLPTVFVPAAAATPALTPTPTSTATATPAASAEPSPKGDAGTVMATPSATPTAG